MSQEDVRIVFTGASLSYNRYDFDFEPRTNAYDCFPGIRSWSFLLKDRWIENADGFVAGDRLAAKASECLGLGRIHCGYERAYVFPNEGRVAVFTAKNKTDEFMLRYQTQCGCSPVLYMLSNPLSTACRFDIIVDGAVQKTVCNDGTGKIHQGFMPFVVKLPMSDAGMTHIRFGNIQNVVGGVESQIYLVGVARQAVYAFMTGQGSTTCHWLYQHCQTRILDYKPGIVFITLGGNDPLRSNLKEFHTALTRIVEAILTQQPKCRIILLTMPPGTRDDPFTKIDGWRYCKSDISQSYCDATRHIAQVYDATYVDLFPIFDGIPVNRWRFDNIHMTQYGNQVLADWLQNQFLA